ncbi:MAG: DEAD/DEAH box helicase, partial [Candidatus Diapherotrites archaeon]|nr:DEAD/DEAH box helicase [Candidatus Diapherotrites archaeon]
MEFKDMKLVKRLLEGIKLMGFNEATGIQEKCIPQIKKGMDVVGQSLTGSGKTAAFGLPILEKITPGVGIQALVLTPTRELCVQNRDTLEMMAKFLPINIISIYGGVGFFQQMEDIKIAEVVVATPGRLLDHLSRGNLKINTAKYVVLDEADKMFEMGFEEDVDRILKLTPKDRQTVMFSATMPKAAQNLIKRYLKTPVYIQEKLQVDKSLLSQVYYDLIRGEKFSLLVHLLKQKTAGPAMVFC